MKKIRSVYLTLALTFLLGVHGGSIALWKDGSPEPVRVFPYPVSCLPQEAREALEQGIRVESIEQLEELAENYLS
ncbi:MAG: BofC C-terminal domain-containing protein [Oscillospiraceae bacterium]|nr:BofC C-terminal domain-containing protein [Oscillospiraceae bacterium]